MADSRVEGFSASSRSGRLIDYGGGTRGHGICCPRPNKTSGQGAILCGERKILPPCTARIYSLGKAGRKWTETPAWADSTTHGGIVYESSMKLSLFP